MRYALSLTALCAVVNAALQLESGNPAFDAAGIQGCISASGNADGAPVVIHNCNTEDVANHSWEVSLFTKFPAGPQQIKVFGTKCLDVKDGVIADGTKLQVWSCTEGNTNQLWTSLQDFTFQLSGTNKCIDLTDGNISDGNQLQIWTCPASGRNDNQVWSGHRVPDTESLPSTIERFASGVGAPIPVLVAENNADGAAVSIAVRDHVAETFPNGNGTWVLPQFPLTGPIKTYDGTKCLDVKDGSDANGNLLQIWTCVEGSTNQQWTRRASPSQVIEWVGKNKCIDLPSGNTTPGTHVQIWDCDPSNSNQEWTTGSV
ncbi:hypothetical protein V5O48_016228 [Marasmius crinis-equi]|uniref:Ricin B lectin domain-containing protein n=1 Tax=Marasmius crinis-equi TaxID=585013 RepID=A0ABR3ESL5_9AGAR